MSDNSRLLRRLIHKIFVNRFHSKLDRKQLFWWLICLGYLLGLIGLFVSPLTRIHQAECFIDYQSACPDFVIPELLKLRGNLIYTQKLDTLVDKLYQAIPSADTITLEKNWPDSLTVRITSLPPVANLTIPASSSALLVNAKYYVVGQIESPQTNLPDITASAAAAITPGDKVTDESILAAIDIINSLKNIDTISIVSPLEIKVNSSQNQRYLFTANKSVADQLHNLHLLLAQTTINSSTTIYDLRYDHPVLKQSW